MSDHAPSGSVEPRPRLVALGDRLEPAPRDEKRLGEDVRGLVRLGSPACVTENGLVVRAVDALETLAARNSGSVEADQPASASNACRSSGAVNISAGHWSRGRSR